MKLKVIALLLVAVMATTLLGACGSNEKSKPEDTDSEATKTDVVTTASIVNDATALKKAMSKDGTWIICTLEDLETEEELVVEGDFYDKNDSKNALYRKIAPYTQDENRKVTARFTITAPKLTVKSPNTKIQGGTFKGDVYVEANGFSVQDATVDGNIYFAKQEYKDSFVLATDEGKEGKVTGTTEVQK